MIHEHRYTILFERPNSVRDYAQESFAKSSRRYRVVEESKRTRNDSYAADKFQALHTLSRMI